VSNYSLTIHSDILHLTIHVNTSMIPRSPWWRVEELLGTCPGIHRCTQCTLPSLPCSSASGHVVW